MIGQSQVFLETLQLVEKIARCEAPVLIEGETGTGKELTGKETWAAIEVKRTLAPQFTKGQRRASQDIAVSRNFTIYPGSERFPLAENIEAVGLADFLNVLMMSK